MKKLMKWCSLIALVALMSSIVGCTTAMEGTSRRLHVSTDADANGQTEGILKTRRGTITRPLPTTFELSTRGDRGKMQLTLVDRASGRSESFPLSWKSEKTGTMLGGAGLLTLVFGVVGPTSLAIDYFSGSYKGLSEDHVYYRFNYGLNTQMPPAFMLRPPPAPPSAPPVAQPPPQPAQAVDCPPMQVQPAIFGTKPR